MNSLKNIIFISIFSILCILAVVHAGINANNIKMPIEEKTEVLWDVVFEKDENTNEIIVDKTENVEYDLPQLFDSIVNDFNVLFAKNDEEITFTFYITNKSEYDSYILHYNKPKLTCLDNEEECSKNLDKIMYTFTYDNGEEVKLNDLIKANEKKKVHVKIKYLNTDTNIPMNLTKLGFSLTFAKVK